VGKAIRFVDTTVDVGKDGYAIEFQVIKSWRGACLQKIVINSPNPFLCGFFFLPGETYLVYARKGVTGQAWGCKELPSAAACEEMEALGDTVYEVHER
jgi:hypothetical protein